MKTNFLSENETIAKSQEVDPKIAKVIMSMRVYMF